MLGIIRRFLNSRIGVPLTLGILVLIGLAFALGDVTGLRSDAINGGPSGSTLVTIGKQTITAGEVKADTERMVAMYRQQYPQLTMEEFITKGGFDQPFENRINTMAMEQFGDSQGMRIGKALADSEITSQAQFKGLDGKFDRDLYKQFLAQQRMGDSELRAEIGAQHDGAVADRAVDAANRSAGRRRRCRSRRPTRRCCSKSAPGRSRSSTPRKCPRARR